MNMNREPVFETEVRRTAPTLSEFASGAQITEDKVWELIEDGQLSAKFIGDSILIMPDQPSFDRSRAFSETTKEPAFAKEVRSLPEISPDQRPAPQALHDDFIEDNHDILMFAQDALSRNAELSKELLATKDELIRLKDERISFLTELLQQKEKEIRTLCRSLDELATLRKFEPR